MPARPRWWSVLTPHIRGPGYSPSVRGWYRDGGTPSGDGFPRLSEGLAEDVAGLRSRDREPASEDEERHTGHPERSCEAEILEYRLAVRVGSDRRPGLVDRHADLDG